MKQQPTASAHVVPKQAPAQKSKRLPVQHQTFPSQHAAAQKPKNGHSVGNREFNTEETATPVAAPDASIFDSVSSKVSALPPSSALPHIPPPSLLYAFHLLHPMSPPCPLPVHSSLTPFVTLFAKSSQVSAAVGALAATVGIEDGASAPSIVATGGHSSKKVILEIHNDGFKTFFFFFDSL